MQYDNVFNGGIYRSAGNIEKGDRRIRKIFLEERMTQLTDYKSSTENLSNK